MGKYCSSIVFALTNTGTGHGEYVYRKSSVKICSNEQRGCSFAYFNDSFGVSPRFSVSSVCIPSALVNVNVCTTSMSDCEIVQKAEFIILFLVIDDFFIAF